MLALTREMYISPPRARSTLGVRLHPRISFALAVTCGMPWGPSPWRAEPWVTRGLPEHLQWVPRPRILSAEDGGFEEQGGHAFSRVSPAEAWGGGFVIIAHPQPVQGRTSLALPVVSTSWPLSGPLSSPVSLWLRALLSSSVSSSPHPPSTPPLSSSPHLSLWGAFPLLALSPPSLPLLPTPAPSPPILSCLLPLPSLSLLGPPLGRVARDLEDEGGKGGCADLAQLVCGWCPWLWQRCWGISVLQCSTPVACGILLGASRDWARRGGTWNSEARRFILPLRNELRWCFRS